MSRSLRALSLAFACAAAVHSGGASAASKSAAVSATVVKPLTLTRLQDLDLGTILLAPGTWSSATVSLSRTGVLSCAGPNVVCSGAVRVAQYKVTGTNKMVVTISAPNVTLTNQLDATKKLTLVPDAPASVTMTSSGQPGTTFPVGGRIALTSGTAGGDYVGTFNVTVDYQ